VHLASALAHGATSSRRLNPSWAHPSIVEILELSDLATAPSRRATYMGRACSLPTQRLRFGSRTLSLPYLCTRERATAITCFAASPPTQRFESTGASHPVPECPGPKVDLGAEELLLARHLGTWPSSWQWERRCQSSQIAPLALPTHSRAAVNLTWAPNLPNRSSSSPLPPVPLLQFVSAAVGFMRKVLSSHHPSLGNDDGISEVARGVRDLSSSSWGTARGHSHTL
jgi:hypothetical protein